MVQNVWRIGSNANKQSDMVTEIARAYQQSGINLYTKNDTKH
jgi:hypothetical protein